MNSNGSLGINVTSDPSIVFSRRLFHRPLAYFCMRYHLASLDYLKASSTLHRVDWNLSYIIIQMIDGIQTSNISEIGTTVQQAASSHV